MRNHLLWKGLLVFFATFCLSFSGRAATRTVWVGQEFALECNPNEQPGTLQWNVKWTYPKELLYAIGGSTLYNRFKVTQYFSGTAYVKCEWEDVYNSAYPGLESSVKRSRSWNITCQSNPVSILESDLSLAIGDTKQLHYQHKYENDYTSSAVTSFYCAETDVVSVTESGEVTAVGEGTAYVYLHSNISGVTPCCTVKVEGKFEGSYVGEYYYEGIRYNINTENKTATAYRIIDDDITDVVIPDSISYKGVICSVDSIGHHFVSLSPKDEKIKSVVIGKNVEYIGHAAFAHCDHLVSVDIPINNIKTIGIQAFYECEKLKYMPFGEKLEYIGEMAFTGCESFHKIALNLPNIIEIGPMAFVECPSLVEVKLGEKLVCVRYGAFNSCPNLKSVNIAAGVIEEKSFSNCSSLTSIELGDAVEEIGPYSFSTSSISTIRLNVRKIGDSSFYSCKNLEKVSIGESVVEIGNRLFSMCYNLKEIECQAKIPPKLSGDLADSYPVIKVPEGCLDIYKKTPIWSFYNIQEITSENIEKIVPYDINISKIYNLQGLEMKDKNNLPNGIYIQGGKKFVVK